MCLVSGLSARHRTSVANARDAVSDINGIKAVVQGIVVDGDGVMWAAADSRKNGIAAGY